MPEFFLELFSEEIPARMQSGGAADLARLVAAALLPLAPQATAVFHGPRRIAVKMAVNSEVEASSNTERGPRLASPEQALAGFLRKHRASREQLRPEGEYWVLDKSIEAVPAPALIARALPPLLRRFPWPKSMRWGGTSAFTWIRPLRRIVCLLEGVIVPFDLREGTDDAHGLAASNLTEGHRFHAPGAFPVSSCADWREKLAERRVLVDAAERRRRIAHGIEAAAAAKDLTVVDDPGLLDEVAGLVEWPVPLLGRIDQTFMELPPEVMQVSMRVNLRYFALRTADGDTAPWFGFAANIEADDGGATIITGNERVLRARFEDARHFWDLDRKTPLASRIPQLDQITFHAKLGSQGERVKRLRLLARTIAPKVGAALKTADRAAELAKADLVTGMVGEFPELQGVMGRYYALHDREPTEVADAIRDHYAPKGPSDAVPSAPVSIVVALADKLDQLAGFFAIGERPTGSGDPFALRRAGLGVIRIIRENGLRFGLRQLIEVAGDGLRERGINPAPSSDILDFLVERLRVQLRSEGRRHDVIAAAFGVAQDDDFTRLEARANTVAALLGTDVGSDLLTAYRRAARILRIEERKDGPQDGDVETSLLREPEEKDLAQALRDGRSALDDPLDREAYNEAIGPMATLRPSVDAFFDRVTVNTAEPELRRNRLRLLNQVRATMDRIADFSKIEG